MEQHSERQFDHWLKRQEAEAALINGALRVMNEGRSEASQAAAFGSAYKTLAPRLVEHARQFVDAASAEEVAQDSLLKLHNQGQDMVAAGYQPFQIRGWLYKITRNSALDMIRRSKAEKRSHNQIGPLDELFASNQPSSADVSSTHVAKEELTEILQLAATDQSVEALLLSVAGYSYEEVADKLGTSVLILKNRIHHARRRLRASRSDF